MYYFFFFFFYIHLQKQNIRDGVVGNISACHADARGSIPRRGEKFKMKDTLAELVKAAAC